MLMKHKKTGGSYKVLLIAIREADLAPEVVYQEVETGAAWTRTASEFFDGRFEAYFPPKEAPTQGRLQ